MIVTQHKRENSKKRNHQKKENDLDDKSDKRLSMLDLGLSYIPLMITMLNLTPLGEFS